MRTSNLESVGVVFILSLVSLLGIGPMAHADPVGLVCLSSSTAGCPAPPATMGGIVGSQVKVFVLVQGSALFNAFDIAVLANHTTLRPVNAVDSGGLLAGGQVVVNCVGGRAISGNCASTDNIDTIHFAETGAFPPSTTGLLFTAIYNVTGSTNTSIGFQTGCSRSSVNSTSICVSFGNGSVSILQETVQGLTFALRPTPTFTLTSTQPSIQLAKGEVGNTTIVLTSINGFSGVVSLSSALTPNVNHPPVVTLSPTSVALSSGGKGTTLVVISSRNNTKQATYAITVTATGGSSSGMVQILATVVA